MKKSTLKTSSLSAGSRLQSESGNGSMGQTCSIDSTQHRAKCAVCPKKEYALGLCRRHWTTFSVDLEKLFRLLLGVVETMAEPGTLPLDEDGGGYPFVARTCRFLNDAAEHWNADWTNIMKSREKAAEKYAST